MPSAAILWRATRPWAFSASITSALLGGLVAVAHGGARLNPLHFALAVIGAAAAHASANQLNDYFDFRKGVDRPGTLGGSGILPAGLMTPAQMLAEGVVLGLFAAALGVYFMIAVTPALWPLLAGGIVCGVGYSVAPTNFKYRALGDLAVFVAFGLGITAGAYTIQTHRLSWVPFAYGLPISFLVAGILHGNNMRDARSDREADTLSLAMLLGPRRAGQAYFGMVAVAYASLIALVLARAIAPPALLALLSAPLALPLLRQARAPEPGAALLGLDAGTARLHMAFGVLMIVGLVGRILL